MTDHSSVDRLGRCRIEDQPECHRSGYSVPESQPDTTSYTTTKGTDKLGNGDMWTFAGPHGRVEYDQHGNHGRIYNAAGECIEALGAPEADRIAEYVQLGDDDAVFLRLGNVYFTDLKYAAVTR